MSITGIENTAAATGKSAAAGTRLADNFDTFLTMLTTQLKHQDPLSPMDSTQFTNQLVQFANVEQQIAANTNLETLIGVNQVNLKAQAISYIGHTIEVSTNALPLQDGKANFSFTLAEDAKSVAVVIRDEDGKAVRSLTGMPIVKGRQEVSWDGKDANGKQLADGLYTVDVAALNPEGKSMESGVTVYGKVTDVASDAKETLLAMGKVVTTVESVLTVRDPASVQSAN